jgi:hypothetical protein
LIVGVSLPNDHSPETCCHAPGGTRIPNLLIRSQMLYPIELQARKESLLETTADMPHCGDTSAIRRQN